MRVVITGGAGFIGSNLVHYWTRQHPDDAVTVIDALTYAGRRESLADLTGRRGFELRVADIADANAMRDAVRGTDLLLNLAAETHNDRAIADPLPFAKTNVLGTMVLLEACRKADVRRVHHVSTDEVYGSLALDDPSRFTESTPYHPRGPYSASKAASDHLVRAWHETYGLATTISNCGNNFGPYQHPEKLIPLAITHLIRGERVPIYGDGKNVRDWIYVEDHCSALDVIAHRGVPGETYLVSAENELSNRELVTKLAGLFGKGSEVLQSVADRPGHDRRYALDPTKLRTQLDWQPRFRFDEALERTARWYRENPSWWAPMVSASERQPP
jgi:dTDP-glucose 4,6-dehydratase